MLRLLTLPDPVRQAVQAGQLTMGHARALVGCEAAEAIADAVRARKLSVRETESLVQRFKQQGWPALSGAKDRAAATSTGAARSPDIEALERDIGNKLGMAVHLKTKGEGGELTIRYRSLEQLDDLLQRLAGRPAGGCQPGGGYASFRLRGMRDDRRFPGRAGRSSR